MAKSVEKKRLTLDLDAPLQRRLKAVAALKGISMREYCQTAIEKELEEDEEGGIPEEGARFSRAEHFAALRQKYFGDRVLPGDSVEFIREAREIRDAQLDATRKPRP
ncbi:MAG: hypothetical protein F4052_06095 [Dehalococcoidia bacterium]|nr:hypothetical protein [Dehalococcoidia bacterium]MYK26503.1 hypothetical protein [Dehalococcoidia bacterium]